MLSLLLFAIAEKVIKEHKILHAGLMNEILYADDLGLISKSMEVLGKFWK